MDKDDVEFLVGQVAETTLGILPFGSVFGKALTIPLELAERKRNSTILAAIQADLLELRGRGLTDKSLEEWAESESFLTSIYVVIRASQETQSDEKRKLLRNALINGESSQWTSDRESFLRALASYEPGHIAILGAVEAVEAKDGQMVEDAEHNLSRKSGRSLPKVWRLMPQLVTDAMVDVLVKNEIESSGRSGREFGQNAEGQFIRQTTYHGMTGRGRSFLEFIRDPLAETPGTVAQAE